MCIGHDRCVPPATGDLFIATLFMAVQARSRRPRRTNAYRSGEYARRSRELEREIISSKSRTQGAVQDCMLRAHRGHLKRRSGSYHRVREPQVRRRERLIYVALTISATAPERAMRRARGSAARRLAAGGSERSSSHCAPSRSGSDAMRSVSPNVPRPSSSSTANGSRISPRHKSSRSYSTTGHISAR